MILADTREQTLQCPVCGEYKGLARRVVINPERFAIAVQHMERDHAICAKYPNDPATARMFRRYERQIRQHMVKEKLASRAA